jgi:hypothetical protein
MFYTMRKGEAKGKTDAKAQDITTGKRISNATVSDRK